MLIFVTLRIMGDRIDPEHISSVLQIQPSTARKTGSVRLLSSGQEIKQRCGIWAFSTRDLLDSMVLDDHIQFIAQALGNAIVDVVKLPFVERAWLDICVVESDIEQNSRGVVVGLSEKSIEIIDRIGVPIEITFYGSADD
jgi:hypothetical protein